jgi:hypothetical protein
MISVGVDAHKSTHVAVALDAAGQLCGQWQGANSADGWAEMQAWAQTLGAERQDGDDSTGKCLVDHRGQGT